MVKKVIIAADYSSLEPRIFAHWSGSKSLQAVYEKGEDLYSRVAIDVLQIPNVSANPNDLNYLGTVAKHIRQEAKIFTLMVPYNAAAGQVAIQMGYLKDNGKPDFQRGQDLIDKYLTAFPELREYMAKCKYMATRKGYVENLFGRRREMPECKELFENHGWDLLNKNYAEYQGLLPERSQFKAMLNAACNFPIQSTAADVVNKAMIELSELFNQQNWTLQQASIRLQVHDEIIVVVDEDKADVAVQLIQKAMCDNKFTKKLLVPLECSPVIATNLAEAK
jgi:DNA polymerase-1